MLKYAPMESQPVIILASNSPRRRQLLTFGGWKFQVRSANVDETPLPGETPTTYVTRLAQEKAEAIAAQFSPKEEDILVIAADTTVVDGIEMFGKPENAEEALEMLQRLRGRTHQVHTGVAILRPADGKLAIEICTTNVPMRTYTDEEMAVYVESGDPMDKAGGYAIQHPEFHPVPALHGCYANVVGLPLCHLTRALLAFSVPAQANIPAACQSELDFECKIYSEVLRGTG